MKKLSLLFVLILTACSSEPQFITKDYAQFSSAKYPPVVIWVNSGSACFGKTKCTYSEKFIEELRETGAFHNIDVYNQQANYRLKIQFFDHGAEKDAVYYKTAGIIPSHIKRKYEATFEIEGEQGMLKTYHYKFTGTDTASLTYSEQDRTATTAMAIRTAVSNFVSDLQRDNVLPLTENY